MKILNLIEINLIKKKKIPPPEVRGIIKINDVAKEEGVYDDENKIIFIYNGDNVIKKIKYTESEVESLREEGIPILEEEYTDEYDFINTINFGQIESWRKL
ncbi:MAG: hypothetical protein QW727_03975 [Candidatus Pacearchaeota archaeon]